MCDDALSIDGSGSDYSAAMTNPEPGGDNPVRQARSAAAAASREIVSLELPGWLRALGTGAWLVVGLVVLLGIVVLLLAMVTPVLIPLAIAVVLASILVPAVDRLERWRVPRWLGAALLLVAGLALVAAVVVLVVRVVADQGYLIWAQLSAGLDKAGELIAPGSDLGAAFANLLQAAAKILAVGFAGSLVSSATVLLVGVVLGLFMLLFLLKDWGQISRWLVGHLGLPPRLASQVLSGTVRAFRGYALGLTEIGVANAVVVGVGALLLQVPLAGPIAVVTFIASYVPYFGAFVAGAFAVVVALGANGLPTALAMLAIVLLANTTIQNLLEPFAFGRSLRLHPLAILITTTAGTLLFGLMGALLAAPVTAAALNALGLLQEAGMFDTLDEARTGPTITNDDLSLET